MASRKIICLFEGFAILVRRFAGVSGEVLVMRVITDMHQAESERMRAKMWMRDEARPVAGESMSCSA